MRMKSILSYRLALNSLHSHMLKLKGDRHLPLYNIYFEHSENYIEMIFYSKKKSSIN
jgi:hypothetical protein